MLNPLQVEAHNLLTKALEKNIADDFIEEASPINILCGSILAEISPLMGLICAMLINMMQIYTIPS
jgi:hypothetical protein